MSNGRKEMSDRPNEIKNLDAKPIVVIFILNKKVNISPHV